jgi:hypothetical protein
MKFDAIGTFLSLHTIDPTQEVIRVAVYAVGCASPMHVRPAAGNLKGLRADFQK